MSDRTILPPATLGVLGGGQLGRMFALAARAMGYGVVALEPDPEAPVRHVVDEQLVAPYDDEAALDVLAARCAVVTTEFENPPSSALERLAARTIVAPNPNAVAATQDRIAEKAFLVDSGMPVGRSAVLRDRSDLDSAGEIGFPAILKTARLGYDGRGQRRVESAEALERSFSELGDVPCVLEAELSLDAELSVVCARGADGAFSAFPVAENRHVDGILDLTMVPADVPPALTTDAIDLAESIAHGLDYRGVLAVELFVVGDTLLVNEVAPRPHNSGHWTLDACRTSQFEQQVRAICGLPLGDTTLTAPVAMLNVLGDAWAHGAPDWSSVLAEPGSSLHLYGKHEARPGRKMGHVTVTGASPAEVRGAINRIRSILAR